MDPSGTCTSRPGDAEAEASSDRQIEGKAGLRQAGSNLDAIVEVSALLALSLHQEEAASRLVQLLVPALVEVCVIQRVRDGDHLELIGVAHVDPRKEALIRQSWRRPLPAADHPLFAVIRENRAQYWPSVTGASLEALAGDAEHLRSLQALAMPPLLLLPLPVRGKGVAILAVGRSERPSEEDELAGWKELASRIAQAIDSVELYVAEPEARQRVELAAARVNRLQDITLALSSSMSAEQAADLIICHAVESAGAASGAIAVVTEDGASLEFLASEAVPRSITESNHRIPIGAAMPVAYTFRTGTAQFVETPEVYKERFPEFFRTHASRTRTQACATIPLVLTSGRIIGTCAIGFLTPHQFSEDERAFLTTLTRQAAQALDRARWLDLERRARVDAEQANRAKDEFLGMVSHELRTPLHAILGWVSLLERKVSDAALIKQGLAVIERNARAQINIIEDLLDVSRITTGKLKLELRPLDIGSIVRAAAEVLESTAVAKGVELRVYADEPSASMIGDPDRLQQIFGNLLSNAVKFTPSGGRVEVRVECRMGEAQISIADTGAGIDPAFLPFLFDRFRQADGSTTRRHGGLGLGLAIVQQLVELHGGRVRAESAGLGLGARFLVSLPLAAADPAAPPAAPPAPAGPRQAGVAEAPVRGGRGLVVDDEADAREITAAVLAASGAIVAAAGSAEEGFQAVRRFEPDVLLCDIAMPGEDGYSLLRRIRSLSSGHARIPAIALTAHGGEEVRKKVMLAGFNAYLTKPAEGSMLCAVLTSAIEHPVKREAPASATSSRGSFVGSSR